VVLPAALIEAATPPSTKPKAKAPAQAKQPLAFTAASPQASGDDENKPRFVTDGITACLQPSLVEPRAVGDLVTKTKTPFVTHGITAAPPPTPAPKAASAERQNKLRVAIETPDKPAPPTSDGELTERSKKLADHDAPARNDDLAHDGASRDVTDRGPQADDEKSLAPQMMPLAEHPAGEAGASPSASKLPWGQPPRRNAEVVAAIKRADARVRHGLQLAERGALFAARAEFIAALKMIAQAYDVQEGTNRYSKAVGAGLAALKEAGDFVRLSDTLHDTDIAKIVLPHSTPVLKNTDTSALTPIAAAQCYYTYAQEQLSAATAQEMCGSMALYAMGKVAIIAAKSDERQLESTGQAIALYRASLIAEPRNYRAANELGVLLAENGHLELARDLLLRSVSVSPQATTWRNLAVVHSRAGQRNLAEHAKGQALALQRAGATANVPAVQWVDPATFASTAPAGDRMPPAVVPSKTEPTPTKAADHPQKPAENVAKKSITDWLRLSPRRQ
jgi:tetratricopeptide (TPR) repeat protein